MERSECLEQLYKQEVSVVARARVQPDAVTGDRHMPVEIESYGRYTSWGGELSSSGVHETVALIACH